MTDFIAAPLVAELLRTTIALTIAAAAVGLLLRIARVSSPTVHRLGCLLVLAIGWSFLRLPLVVPWYEPIVPETIARAPLPVVALPDLKDLELAELASEAVPEPTMEWPRQLVVEAPLAVDTAEASEVPETKSATYGLPALTTATVGWVPAIWLAGMALIMFAWLVGYIRFVRRLPVGQAADADWLAEWRELLAARGVSRAIPLRVTAKAGPMLCRLPRGYELLVPAPLWQALTTRERACILRHELAHYERGDVWKSLAARVLALPHWFNPAAWWAVGHFDEAAEWACDRAAAGQEPATAYAKALLRLGEAGARQASYSPAARGRTLSRRIRRVLTRAPQEDSRTKKLMFVIAACAIVAAALVRIELIAKEPAGDSDALSANVTDRNNGDDSPHTVSATLTFELATDQVADESTPQWRGLLGLAAERQDTFRLTADELKRGWLRVAVAKPAPPDKLVLRGQTVVETQRAATVHSPLAGHVLDVAVGPAPGERELKQGQVLATVRSKDLAEKKGELFDAAAEQRLNEQVLARLKDRATGGATSEQAHREAEKQVADGKVAVNKIERTLQAWRIGEKEIEDVKTAAAKPSEDEQAAKQQAETWGRFAILSPIDGVVVERNINVGDVIAPSLRAFRIADLSELSIDARVFEEDISRLQSVPEDRREWAVRASVVPALSEAKGTFGPVDAFIDPIQHSALVHGSVANVDGKLRAGLNVTATVDLPADPTLVVIPAAAVIHDGGAAVAFVGGAADSTEFERRKISVVRRFANSVWVRSTPNAAEKEAGLRGINAGDRLLAQAEVAEKPKQESRESPGDTEVIDDRIDKTSSADADHRARARQLLCSSARNGYKSAAEDYLHGRGPLERVYDWSKLWMTAEADPAVAPSARVGAREMHLERMKNLHEVCKARVKADEEQKSQLDKTESYVREAEQSLATVDRDGAAKAEDAKREPGIRVGPTGEVALRDHRVSWVDGAVIHKGKAVAFLRIARNPEVVRSLQNETQPHESYHFMTLRNVTMELLRNESLLRRVVRTGAIAELPLVKSQPDAVTWLQDSLQLSYPNDADLLKIELTLSDPNQAVQIVNALMDAYFRDVVQRQAQERAKKKTALTRALDQRVNERQPQQRFINALRADLEQLEREERAEPVILSVDAREASAALTAPPKAKLPNVAEPGKSTAAARDVLRYDGKGFAEWVEVLENDLSPERKVEAMRALAAFGAHGHAQDAISKILSGVRYHDAPRDDAVTVLTNAGFRSPDIFAEMEALVDRPGSAESVQLIKDVLGNIRNPQRGKQPVIAPEWDRKERRLKAMIDDRSELLIRAKKDVDNLQRSLQIVDPAQAAQQMSLTQNQLGLLNNSILAHTSEMSNLEVKVEDFKLEIMLAQDPQAKEARAEEQIEKDARIKRLEEELGKIESAIEEAENQVQGKDGPVKKRLEQQRSATEDKIAMRRDELLKKFSDVNEALKVKELQGRLAATEKHRDAVREQIEGLKKDRADLTKRLEIITRDTAELDTRKQNLRVAQQFLDELNLRLYRLQLERFEADLDRPAKEK